MKKTFLILFLLVGMLCQAGITTYTFTSAEWGSKQGTTVMDGKTDGWVCNKAGLQYDKPQYQYQAGVKVTANYSGAGATTVKSFTNVRRLTLNYATTTSGKGSFRIQVGDNTPIDTAVSISEKNIDMVVDLPTEQTGKITVTVTCTKNSIWLASVAIRHQGGDSPVFTEATYQLVTDVHQLQDSDQIIFGVADGTTDKIMGYYDENISQNNIHAIQGVYTDGRTVVKENDDAVYTLWKTVGETNQDTVYIFQDELRYEQAYLVASGGRTKNKLTIWDDVVSPSYGNYGFWRMTIADDGAAVIENAGTSERKYMQYNASNVSYGCYADPNSQTKVCLFRKVEAPGMDDPAIAVRMVNFGTVRLAEGGVSGQTTVEVNANKLTEDMTCTLKRGEVFTLNTSKLDRDGDRLTISYHITAAGKYVDTLVVTSSGVTAQVAVMINVVAEKTIAQAMQSGEYEFVYLNPVVVTKKYDTYIFIRDETGSMLIYDAVNPQTGKPYGQGLENGHVLSNVQGHFRNYFGVPEMTPNAAWTVAAKKTTCDPETVTAVDSADVCRYVRMTDVVVEDGLWQGVPVLEKFQTGSVIQGVPTTLDAIVMIDHDVTQLWVVKQEYNPTGLDEQFTDSPIHRFTVSPIHHTLFLRHNGHTYNANGQIIK